MGDRRPAGSRAQRRGHEHLPADDLHAALHVEPVPAGQRRQRARVHLRTAVVREAGSRARGTAVDRGRLADPPRLLEVRCDQSRGTGVLERPAVARRSRVVPGRVVPDLARRSSSRPARSRGPVRRRRRRARVRRDPTTSSRSPSPSRNRSPSRCPPSRPSSRRSSCSRTRAAPTGCRTGAARSSSSPRCSTSSIRSSHAPRARWRGPRTTRSSSRRAVSRPACGRRST